MLIVRRFPQRALRGPRMAVVELKLEGHLAALQPFFSQAGARERRDVADGGPDLIGGCQIAREGPLIRYGLGVVGLIPVRHPACLTAGCAFDHAWARNAEHAAHLVGILCRELAQGMDAKLLEPLLGRASDAAHGAHRQGR